MGSITPKVSQYHERHYPSLISSAVNPGSSDDVPSPLSCPIRFIDIQMPSLPLAVTVGFSGPRSWYSYRDYPDLDPSVFQEAAAEWLKNRLVSLPAELGLAGHHFLTGISQIALGGDHAFTAACRDLGIPQIVSLPQPSDAYLEARSSSAPDFTEDQKQQARDLLASPHIIQEKVASEVADRHARFEETNIELVRQSDILIAMVKPGDSGKPGGTWDVIQQAVRWGTPVLVVTVHLEDGEPSFAAEWEENTAPGKSCYRPPFHPEVIDSLPETKIPTTPAGVPERDAYFTAIKTHASAESKRLSGFFQNAAWTIIGTHFFATVCAVLALVLIKDFLGKAYYPAIILFLVIELGLLVWGYLRHHRLHDSETASCWAMNRLLSEVARSAIAFWRYHVGFAHLWRLNLPAVLNPLLRTMEILQLRETRANTCADWQDCRDTYLKTRLTDPRMQLDFYYMESEKADRRYHLTHKVFIRASLLAIAATALKLLFILAYLVFHIDGIHFAKALLGFFGVLCPVVAVAALSLAAANDLEARSHTFKEMHDFLTRQAALINAATSEREFAKLLNETEPRLLGETVTWFSRRSFTGVA